MKPLFAVILCVAVLRAEPPPKGESKPSPIYGKWDGKPEAGGEGMEAVLTFKPDGDMEIFVPLTGDIMTGTYTLDTSVTPHKLDMKLSFGKTERATYTIIEFAEDNTAQMADPTGSEAMRPSTFNGKGVITLTKQQTAKAVKAEDLANALLATWKGDAAGMEFTFKPEGKFSGTLGGEVARGTYKIDAAKSPAEFEITTSDTTLLFIFQLLDDGELKIQAITDPEQAREFTEEATTMQPQ